PWLAWTASARRAMSTDGSRALSSKVTRPPYPRAAAWRVPAIGATAVSFKATFGPGGLRYGTTQRHRSRSRKTGNPDPRNGGGRHHPLRRCAGGSQGPGGALRLTQPARPHPLGPTGRRPQPSHPRIRTSGVSRRPRLRWLGSVLG